MTTTTTRKTPAADDADALKRQCAYVAHREEIEDLLRTLQAHRAAPDDVEAITWEHVGTASRVRDLLAHAALAEGAISYETHASLTTNKRA